MAEMNNEQQVFSMMRSKVQSISASCNLQEAAQMMKELGCGILPVGNPDNPVGVITDRDIILRAVAEGKNMKEELVKHYMTPEIRSCNENDTIEEAAYKMNEYQISRLLVENENGRVCGILTFGHIMRKNNDQGSLGGLIKNVMQKKAA